MSSTSTPSTHHEQYYLHHFRWDSSVPHSVSIKGSFDHWQSTLRLNQLPSGKFSAPIQLDFGTRISYKYIVDGAWRHNPNEPFETDVNGNINNVFQVPHSPSNAVDPAPHSVQLEPNSATTMSSGALSEESSSNSSLNGLPMHSQPQIDDNSNSPSHMSVAFPSTSTDQLPELIQCPQRPSGTKRTTSLFASATRFARPSYRATSLASSAPGTPTEKATPVGASVSNVVSALAGVAATAIPAAILAVTGKDITRSSSKHAEASSNGTHDSPVLAHTTATPQPPEQTLSSTEATPNQQGSTEPLIQSIHPLTESSPLPLNEANQNSQPKDGALVHAPATHQALPEPSLPTQAGSISTLGNIKPAQATDTLPKEPLPLTEIPAATIILTPPSVSPIVPTSPLSSPEPATSNLSPCETTIEPPGPPTQASEQLIPHPQPSAVKQDSTQRLHEEPALESTQDVQQQTILLPSHGHINPETPARVSFTEERPQIGNQPSVTPKRCSILSPSPSVSPPLGNSNTESKKATTTPTAAKNEQFPFLGSKSSRSETHRKTSGWRYSIGSIRSRRTSGDTHRPCVTDDHPQDSYPNENDGPSPRVKRRSGIFQKIKSAFSPHKQNSKKRNSFGRTATMNQD